MFDLRLEGNAGADDLGADHLTEVARVAREAKLDHAAVEAALEAAAAKAVAALSILVGNRTADDETGGTAQGGGSLAPSLCCFDPTPILEAVRSEQLTARAAHRLHSTPALSRTHTLCSHRRLALSYSPLMSPSHIALAYRPLSPTLPRLEPL